MTIPAELLIVLLGGLGVTILGAAYRLFPIHKIYSSKQHLEAAFDSIEDPLAIVDASYTVCRANKAYSKLVSLPYSRIVGSRCHQLLRLRSTPCTDCLLAKSLEWKQRCFVSQSPHPRNPDGFFSFSFYPFHAPASTPPAVVEHIRDITTLEILKTNLEEQNRVLAKTTRTLKKAQEKINEELTMATQVQLDLLPRSIPRLSGFRLAVTYHPIQAVGGDIYDFIPMSDSRLGIFIGDASGHGLASAFVGTISKMSLYHNTKTEMSTSELMTRMNNDLLMNIHMGNYLTCFWGIVDLGTMTLTYTRAGHPKPVLIRNKRQMQVLSANGTFIGILDNPVFEEKTVSLQTGDRLYCFTDGIYEVMGEQGIEGGTLGYRTFQEILYSCSALPFDTVIPVIKQKLTPYTYEDDYTLIVGELTDKDSS